MILWKAYIALVLAIEFGGGERGGKRNLVASQAIDIVDQARDDTSTYQVREILLKVFEDTKGFEWTDSTNWFQQREEVCSWSGVLCYGDDETDERKRGQIQVLDLTENNLVGTVPSLVFQIPYLEELNLDDNADMDIDLSGLSAAQHLTRLALSNTQVSQLNGIANAASLEVLHISGLNLRGSLPSEIFEIESLTAVYANFNKFYGTISSTIGRITNLIELYLYDNDLTGQIPTEIGLLSRLEILSLAQNAFGGTLPTQLNMLTDLQTLAIQRESGSEKGPGIEGNLPSFRNLGKITELYLENQRLSGDIELDFLMNAPRTDQVKVDLSSNLLTGSVPASLLDIKYLDIYLQDNQITAVNENIYSASGGCPEIATWMSGDIGDIGCDAFLCPPGSWAPQGRATSSVNCEVCNDSNAWWGRVDCDSSTPSNVQERQVLVNLYNRMGGRFWNEDTNWLDFAVDVCDWHGISCTSNGLVNGIDLQNNELTSIPPTEIFELPELQSLNLKSNAIDFEFTGIANAQKLTSLDLSNTRLSPSSLDQLQQLASLNQLSFFSIASNDLGGNLPKSLFQLTTLKQFSFAHNKFSGTLHSEIRNMRSLTHFGCAGNELTGQFPSEIGAISSLLYLYASENKFTGSLPTELGLLSNLQVLGLHQITVNQEIGGPLPPFENLQQLTSLELDANRITGNLPVNFLQNTLRANDRIEISLSFNQLQGTVPAQWSRFSNLWLDLTANQITGIDSSLCSKNAWMDGGVGRLQCDAILCPSRTFNDIGRAGTEESSCSSCSDGNQYLGATTCGNGEKEDAEIDILLKFFHSTNGGSWKENAGWSNSPNKCQDWFGIECNGAGNVVSIDLTDNGLSDTPDTAIFQLPNLRELHLSNNPMSFSFDGISQATSLVTLDLGNTGLDSVEGISDASASLLNLRLHDNHLQGEIPGELFLMPELRELYLGFNQLSGNIPSNVGNWVNLETLRLEHNHLTGPIPALFGSLTNLQELILAENNFDGTIPKSLNQLTKLRVLSLQREGGVDGLQDIGINQGDTSVLGPGLTGPLPAFDNLEHMEGLFLGLNSLTGPVPYNFLDGVSNKLSSEIKVDLTSNLLTGMLPASLTQFDRLSIYVGGNRITDIAPGLCLKQNWLNGDVQSFNCDGILCPANTYNPVGRKTSDEFLCMSCQGQTTGYLGGFECLSSDERQQESERVILEKIYKEMDGDNWVYSNNWMDSEESICNWYGIQCISDDEESVASIHLERNQLRNQLPSEIYQLPNLQELSLQGNEIVFTTTGIGNAKNLEYLDLEETGLQSLDGIQAASELSLLRVDNNKLNAFPDPIVSLSKLEVLSLSRNSFPGAGVPSSLQNLGNLVYFACSECGFLGALPTWLGGFFRLEYLRLDRNAFTGSLPMQLQALMNLKHIDLADQKSFGGGISGNLTDFASQSQLTEIFLQHNDIVGTIPRTLLQNVNKNELVTIDLRQNKLSGGIPTELGLIPSLNLYVANNQIDVLPAQICSNSWNEGNVQSHGCDGILCDKGKFNAYGRAIGGLGCFPCDQASAGGIQYFGSTTCGPMFEHTILIQFYRNLNGPNWNRDHNWLATDDHCTWEGITCYTEGEYQGKVQKIDLEDNNMVGTSWASIWQFEGLTFVNLGKNEISFSFDLIANAINLESLLLSETKISSLAGIGAAPVLKALHITNSELVGSLPDELYSLTLLEELYLSYNELSGTMSSRFGEMKALRDLYLFSNNFYGTLPTELGRLASIQHLSLGKNDLSGTIPSEIMSLPFLELLSLHMESVEFAPGDFFATGGGGFSGTLPALDGLPRLKELYLGHNGFVGSIPDHFLQGILNKDQPITVDISENYLTGSIPRELSDFQAMNLYAAGNNIQGIDPEICAKVGWMNGEVLSGCDAILCLPGTYNEFGRRVDSETPCEVCTYPGFPIDIYGSVACGPVLVDSFDDRAILFEFYDSTGGDGWKDSSNWKQDSSPICDWFGVKCEPIGDFGTMTVTELNLEANNLNGFIPSILYHLPALKKLNVVDNDVKITFNAIKHAPVIEGLFLDGTQVSNLDGIDQATTLKTLHLSRNSFNWQHLPDELFGLESLTDLDIHNARFAGSLSTMIGRLTNLKSLNMVENDITGQIPSEIGNLSVLEELFLSNNDFYGTLPESMGGLVSLVTLSIENTEGKTAGITGPLRPFSTMPGIKEINLTDNQLTGSIPVEFLSGVTNLAETINVRLEGNHLIGTVPSQLSRLTKLNIELADNLIVGIGDGLCDQSQWLDGTVGMYSCDGILCPAGQWSEYGRQVSDDSGCEPCPGAETSPYLGVSTCLSIQKQREREILELFFQATNGNNWKNNDGWLDDAVDICSWYGISCREGATVESILLGSNHLVGTPPKDLFDLPNLKFLWLYSNPLGFSFEGIGQATSLRSLLLDSTGLDSLAGIGDATSLVDLDVRFNQLKGPLPQELDMLLNLETLSVAENLFSGPVPGFGGSPKLNTLRLGGNRFTGPLPSFSGHAELKSLDLSENMLTGSIPSDLLESADTTATIFLDLSENQLTGTIPGELARFDDLTLYLRDNKMEGLDPALCGRTQWNGGDVGSFQCDGILCPTGTYSVSGRASRAGARCELCEGNTFFGSTTCGDSAGTTNFRIGAIWLLTAALAMYGVIF